MTPLRIGLGQCRDYRGIENGRRVLEGTSEGDTVTFICNEGFNLLGNRQVECGSDGDWIGSWPVCIKGIFTHASTHTHTHTHSHTRTTRRQFHSRLLDGSYQFVAQYFVQLLT